MTIYKGNKETLTATFNPTTTSSNEITWTSSNPSVVSVDSSKTTNKKVTITAKKAGTATITATHKYGKKATCKVSVITDVTAVIGNPINVKSGFLKDSHNGMRYIKSIPENPTENMPLIIFLHGDGEEDSMRKLEKLPISQYVKSKTAYKAGKFVFIAPLRTSGHWASGSTLNKLMSVIEKTIKEYKIDRNRIILTGMSSGGNATWNIACKYQNFFAGIVPMSAKTGGASASKLTNLPIYGICGNKTSDEKERNRQMRKLINEINKKNGRIITKFEVHENAKHGTIQQYYKSYNLFRWMLSQRRNSNK